MKYYSEILDKLFDTEEILRQEEQEHESKQKEKDTMYDRVVDALKQADMAREEYEKLRDEYIKKYGTFIYAHSKKNSSEFPFTFFI